MSMYGREGVTFAWPIDPSERSLEADQNEGGRFRPAGSWRGDAKAAARPFEALSFELAARPFEALSFELAALWAG